jgi:hypothetical protein
MARSEKSIQKHSKPPRTKVRVSRVEVLRPQVQPKDINFIGWAKKGKDASCT